MHVGFVVNPIAGMGGRVGLKGTDGKVEEARRRGAEPRAPGRAVAALETLAANADDLELLVAGGDMGEREATRAGVDAVVVTHPGEETSAEDTREAVREFVERGVDLVLFVGGDGTAVDVAAALATADAEDVPMLGVPAGVKVYSEVFGVTPRAAGRIAASFDRTEQAEVNDIDEDAYRGGEVHTELRAVVQVPVAEDRQSSKQVGGGTVETLAEGFAADVRPDTTYVLGPGSTVGAIKHRLGFESSPLGVDVWRDGDVLAYDATEEDVLHAIEEADRVVIVVSPIGGQGFVFGRGNHQISPAVIRRADDVVVVASPRKLDDIGVLRVDTDDEDLNEALRGWQKVRVGRFEHRLLKVV